VPSDFYTPKFIPLLTAIGETERAAQLVRHIARNTQQELDFYLSKGALYERKVQFNMLQLQELIIAAQDSGMLAEAKQLEQPFMQYLQRMRQ
jgi:hypothetical protein